MCESCDGNLYQGTFIHELIESDRLSDPWSDITTPLLPATTTSEPRNDALQSSPKIYSAIHNELSAATAGIVSKNAEVLIY